MYHYLKRFKLPTNPYLLFLPFLIVYAGIAIMFHASSLYGDEVRYYTLAQNLTHGSYSYPPPNIAFANGPGYPFILLPFVAFGAPVILMTLLNAVFYYLSVVFVFKTLKLVTSPKRALFFSIFWACYYNSFQEIPFVLTEPLTSLLTSLLSFCMIKAFQKNVVSNKKYIYLSGFLLGYLVLTKIAFGYVLIFMLGIMLILLITKRHSLNYRKGAIVLSIAFLTTVPYLVYTFNVTGKILYWGTSGGDSLYWMSTPFEGEYGDWSTFPRTPKPDKNVIPSSEDSFKVHHEKIFDEIYQYKGINRDDAFKKAAIKNIKSNPKKFVENCISNISRMLFSFPNSYTLQSNKTLLRLPLNGFIVVLSLFCLIPTFLNWRKMIFPIRMMLFLVLLYLGESTLVSGATRMFTVIVPILLLWLAFVLQNSIKVNLKFKSENEDVH